MTDIITCRICEEIKGIEEYYHNSRCCKKCHNQKRNKYARKSYYVKKGGRRYDNEDTIQKVRELRNDGKKWIDISNTLDIKYVSLMRLKKKYEI